LNSFIGLECTRTGAADNVVRDPREYDRRNVHRGEQGALAAVLRRGGGPVLGEDEWVVGRWTATGTHLGLWGAVAPTGKQVTFSAVNVCRFENGKVAEIWNHRDDMGLSEQIGSTVHAGAVPDA
jgi:SnoaL-like polyketide cyclase